MLIYLFFDLEKHLALLENLREFKKMLAGIGQDNSELSGGLECFDVVQSRMIVDYINTRSVYAITNGDV